MRRKSTFNFHVFIYFGFVVMRNLWRVCAYGEDRCQKKVENYKCLICCCTWNPVSIIYIVRFSTCRCPVSLILGVAMSEQAVKRCSSCTGRILHSAFTSNRSWSLSCLLKWENQSWLHTCLKQRLECLWVKQPALYSNSCASNLVFSVLGPVSRKKKKKRAQSSTCDLINPNITWGLKWFHNNQCKLR